MILKELPPDRDLEFPHIMQVRASAGSGKTYILSLRFLQFLLSNVIPDNSPERILAITFTNNATEEMRSRILKFLKLIYLRQDNEIIDKISRITTVNNIREKAGTLIDELLANFDSFQVRTIDSFVNLIIRASTYELGLPPEYEIISNTGEFVDMAFARLISKIPSDPRIRGIFFQYIDNLNKPDFRPWDDARKHIRSFIEHEHNFHETVRSIDTGPLNVEKVLEEITHVLEELLNTSGNRDSKKIEEALMAIRSRASLSFIANKLASIGTKVAGELNDKIGKFMELYSKSTLENILYLFEEVKREIDEIKRKSRRIFLSELNWRINEFLRSSHPTWIYYKLGETIKHYLIDEFQDTSELQWANIEPLIENSLAEGGSLFFVGDQKQLLYRFRGSSFKTFDLPVKRFGRFRTYEIVLDKNWRSRENIVQFVNSTFNIERIEKLADNKKVLTGDALETVREAYKHIHQKASEDNKGGRVVVNIGGKKEEFFNWLDEILNDVTERFEYGDIAILLRNNSNVNEVTKYLSSRGIPVVSSSSLDIRNNHVIRAIKSLLTFLDFPPDDLAFARFISSPVFTEITGMNFEDWLFENREHEEVPLYRRFRDDFKEIWDKYIDDLFKGVGYYPPYDLVWQILKKLRILEKFKDSEAFVQKLMDIIYRLEENGALSLKEILEKLESGDVSIFRLDMPVDENAIRVMTIHGSKGLEFEVVITWANEKTESSSFSIFQTGKDANVFLAAKDIVKYSNLLRSMKESVSSWNMVDRLNILYVALTRAKSELYVYFGKSDKLKDLTEPVEIGEPLRGKPFARKERKTVATSYRFIDWTKNLANSIKDAYELKEPVRRGDFIHRVLAKIDRLHFRPDEIMFPAYIKELIKDVSVEYGAENTNMEEIYPLFERFFSNPEVTRLFNRGSVFTEKEIYSADGEHLRIDRLVFLDDEIFVVEFKTGEPRKKDHEIQVKKYKKVIQELHPDKNVSGFIVYFDRSEVVRV